MALSIRHKLIIAFSLLALFVTLVAFVAMLLIFRAGFLQYLNDLRFSSLNQLQLALSEQVSTDGQWKRLVNSKRVWHEFVRNTLPNARDGFLDPKPRKEKTRPPPHLSGEGRRPPPHRRPPPSRQPYLLLDSGKNIIHGREQNIANLKLAPIMFEGSVLAYVGIKKLNDIDNNTDKMFVEKQTYYFIVVAILACLLAVLAAFFIAAWMTSPIQRLLVGMNRLMQRDYTVEVNYKADDEIGSLFQSFNQLTSTLQHHQQSQQQWIADISHELRTPLSTMKAELESIQDGVRVLSIDRVYSLHEDILRLQRLVDDLHELALSDSGTLNYRFAPVSVNQVLENIFDQHEIDFQSKQLHANLNTTGNQYALSAYADEDRLHQLFENLLQNSLRYTDAGGRIQVNTKLNSKNAIVVEWEDSTPGVPTASINKLFDRLYREEKSRNRAKGGSGLGLSICKSIVEAHSGHINASHSDLGGLKITIVLPKSKS